MSGPALERDAERFIAHLVAERGLSDNTVAAYRRDLRRYVAFLTARNVDRPDEVDAGVVRSFVASVSVLQSKPQESSGEKGQGWSATVLGWPGGRYLVAAV